MSKQFIKGNVYVFTKERFAKSTSKPELADNRNWVNRINGNEVTVVNRFSGEAGNFSLYVNPNWCKCIKNNNPKFKEEN